MTRKPAIVDIVFFPAILKPYSIEEYASLVDLEPTAAPTPSSPEQRATVGAWSWSEVADISETSAPAITTDAHQAAIAVAPDGTIYAVWAERLAVEYSVLYYSVHTVAGWGEPERFVFGEEPEIAVTADGVAHLVFSNEMGGAYDVFYTAWDGGSWKAPVNVSGTSGTSSQPAIEAKSDGKLVVVWTDTTGGAARIYHAWQVQGVWNTFPLPNSYGGSYPDVAAGKGDRAWISWQSLETDPTQYDIYTIYGDGINWIGYAINVSHSTNTESTSPSLMGLSDQGAFVVWEESDGVSASISYADTVAVGDWWGSPVGISQPLSYCEKPSLAASKGGDVYVAWDEGDALAFRYRLGTDGTWGPSSPLFEADPGGDIGGVALVASPGRHVHAVWSQSTVAAPDDRAAYYRYGAPILPHQLFLSVISSP